MLLEDEAASGYFSAADCCHRLLTTEEAATCLAETDIILIPKLGVPKDDLIDVKWHHFVRHLVDVLIGDCKVNLALAVNLHLHILLEPTQKIWVLLGCPV